MVSKLGTSFVKNIGPNTLQKVMAGDKVTATVQYYYQGTAGGNNTNFPATVLSVCCRLSAVVLLLAVW